MFYHLKYDYVYLNIRFKIILGHMLSVLSVLKVGYIDFSFGTNKTACSSLLLINFVCRVYFC